jgi:hypothetical protein
MSVTFPVAMSYCDPPVVGEGGVWRIIAAMKVLVG